MSDQFCVWSDIMEDQWQNVIIVSVYGIYLPSQPPQALLIYVIHTYIVYSAIFNRAKY